MTTTERDELSVLTLDVYWASGKPSDPRVEEHVAGCARCRAYLADLDAMAAAGGSAPARKRSRWSRRTWPIASALAIAAAAFLVVRGRSTPRGYVGTKGAPSVQLLVHRGASTWVWDGRAPVHPGDSIALRVSCAGLERVAVAAPVRTEWARLAESTCPGADEALPFTLVVDAEPADESFGVVFSREAMGDRALREAVEATTRTSGVWVTRFVVPKETETPR
jgi:hypothetical protein